jgi:hypothetical protein
MRPVTEFGRLREDAMESESRGPAPAEVEAAAAEATRWLGEGETALREMFQGREALPAELKSPPEFKTLGAWVDGLRARAAALGMKVAAGGRNLELRRGDGSQEIRGSAGCFVATNCEDPSWSQSAAEAALGAVGFQQAKLWTRLAVESAKLEGGNYRQSANEIMFLPGCPPATLIKASGGMATSGVGETTSVDPSGARAVQVLTVENELDGSWLTTVKEMLALGLPNNTLELVDHVSEQAVSFAYAGKEIQFNRERMIKFVNEDVAPLLGPGQHLLLMVIGCAADSS